MFRVHLHPDPQGAGHSWESYILCTHSFISYSLRWKGPVKSPTYLGISMGLYTL